MPQPAELEKLQFLHILANALIFFYVFISAILVDGYSSVRLGFSFDGINIMIIYLTFTSIYLKAQY